MNDKIIFTRVLRLQYKNEDYDMFISDLGKLAFLKVNKDDNYEFPTYEAFKAFAKHFYVDKNFKYFSNKHKKFAFIPMIVTGASTIILTSSILFNMCAANNINTSHIQAHGEYYGINAIGGVCENEDYKVYLSMDKVDVYNTDLLDVYFGTPNYTLNEVINAISSKKDFSQEMKDFIIEFVTTMHDAYPNIDFRIFYENLKTLKIREFTKDEELFISSNVTAFYSIENNEIGLRNGIDLTEGTRDAMTLRHELGHVFNNLNEVEKYSYTISFDFNQLSYGDYADEAIIAYLTYEPYKDRYPEDVRKNHGYPLQVNLYQLIFESLPGYDLSELLRKNVTHLETEMDKHMGDVVDAKVIIKLIDTQAIDRNSDDGITIDDTQYDEIYEYIATLYIRAHFNKDMTEEEFIYHKNYFIDTLGRGIVGEKFFNSDKLDDTYLNFELIENIFDSYALEHFGFVPESTNSISK